MKKVDLNLATPQQVKEIGADINNLEKMLESDRRSPSPKIQDVAEFTAEINKKKQLLKDHSPKPFRGKNKDKAWSRIKELDSYIKENMPKRKDYYRTYPKNGGCDNDFERAVKHQIFCQTNKKFKKAVEERKYLAGRLEPHDPTIRNIENLRR